MTQVSRSARLRRLAGVGVAYLVGWRGLLIGLATVTSAAIVGVATASVWDAVVALLVVGFAQGVLFNGIPMNDPEDIHGWRVSEL